jgi:two-component system, cell cycle sensor histidine kinase and response regulator CckA
LESYAREQSNIELVVLDLIMPNMGGKRCLEELLKINPRVKVIISTGHTLNPEERDYLGAAACAFVNKPYDTTQLVQAAKEAIDSEGPAG